MTKKDINFNDSDFSLHLKNGNLAAFEVLFDELYPKLYNYILKMSNNHDVAEDIVQNAFIKLWERKNTANSELSIENYLITICRNEYFHFLRKKKKEKRLLDELKHSIIFEIITEKEYDVRLERLEKAIEELPLRTREAFVLSRYESLKYKEIALNMGISVKTVEKHISKALQLIKSHFS